MIISKSILGATGEYYVAAELGKRNIYAQLTVGNQKRTDLLIFSEDNDKLLKIEVKCKQGNEWPNCKGICQKDSFLIFVDLKGIEATQRPVFYVLSVDDWEKIVINKEREYLKKHPDRKTKIEQNVLILLSEVNKQGIPYKGCGIKPKDIELFMERWDSICNLIK